MHLDKKPNNPERKNYLLEIFLTPFRRILEMVLKRLPNQDLKNFSLEELKLEWHRLSEELKNLPRVMWEQGRGLDFDHYDSGTHRIVNRMIAVVINYRARIAEKTVL